VLGSATATISTGSDQANAVAVQSNGQIVAAGQAGLGGGNVETFAVVRYNPDLTLDTSFGNAGIQTTDITQGEPCKAEAIALQSAGKIVLAGTDNTNSASTGYDNFAVARYTTSGQLDTSFGGGKGFVTINVSGKLKGKAHPNSDANAVAIDGSGRIIVGGWAYNGSHNDFALARYTSAGVLDTTFNSNGPIPGTIQLDLGNSSIKGIAVDSLGRYIVAGSSGTQLALARFTSAGVLDTTFGVNGTVIVSLGSNSIGPGAITLDGSGKIIVVGGGNVTAPTGVSAEILVARFNSDGTLDTTFASGAGYEFTDASRILYGVDNTSYGSGVVIDSTGHIAVGGFVYDANVNGNYLVARYNSDGSLDTTFNRTGIVSSIPNGDQAAYANGIAIAAGNYVLAGRVTVGSYDHFGVVLVDPPAGGSPPSTSAATSPTDSSSTTDGPSDLQAALAGLTAATGGPAIEHEASPPIRVAEGRRHPLRNQDWAIVAAGKHGHKESPVPHLDSPARPTDLLDGVFANWSADWV
jgi:uncharacterized delta-60 repeat protein